MIFESRRIVRFADCDPAGIVFFPQYLVMMNTLHEQWFDEALGVRYCELIGPRRTGWPTVRLEVDFTDISRHGDTLVRRLAVRRLGRSSVDLRITFHGEDPSAQGVGSLRLRARQVLVCTSLDTHRPCALPEDIRGAMQRFVHEEADA